MRISDWSSDVCSSDLRRLLRTRRNTNSLSNCGRGGGFARAAVLKRPANRSVVKDMSPMNIHEYQAKELLAKFGVPVPAGYAALSVEEAVAASKKLPCPLYGVQRSEERRVGKGGVSQCNFWWSPDHKKK